MKLGVAYYPEHEAPEEWRESYRKAAEAGITSVRIAEFAWAVIEPREGEYHWKWLDQAIDLAGEYGLDVVLCTPTACPPIWLVEKHPDILPVNGKGKTIGFGARQHRSYSSPHYVEHSLRITGKMAERYGSHPGVIAWQLDNEFGGETKYDFSDNAKKAFHAYLEKKYGTIEKLNASWGTVFWSQRYERWDQIPLPAPFDADVTMWHNPGLELEFARFSSYSMTEFARQQARVLRPHIGERPITHNAFMFCWGDNVNWLELFDELDVAGMDIYSDKPHEIAFYCDAARGVRNRPFWMMEFGTGSNDLARDLDIARVHGASRFYLFKMKPFPWGQEQGRGAPELLTLTGEPSRNYGVVKQYTEGLEAADTERRLAPGRQAGKVGLYYHFESSWSCRISVSDRRSYPDYLVHTVYRGLYDTGRQAEVLYAPEQLDALDLDLLLIPMHVLYDPALEDRLVRFVADGGKLAVTSDLFRKNAANAFLTKVTRLFGELFQWRENNFPEDAAGTREELFRSCSYGKGKAWLLPRDASAEEWLRLLEEAYPKE